MTTPTASTQAKAKRLSEFFKSIDTRILVPLVQAFASNKAPSDLTNRLEQASSISEVEAIHGNWIRNKSRFPS